MNHGGGGVGSGVGVGVFINRISSMGKDDMGHSYNYCINSDGLPSLLTY